MFLIIMKQLKILLVSRILKYHLNLIDLKTIEKRLLSNYYHDKASFIKDIALIFENARIYNQPETIYYKAAYEMETFIRPYLDKLKEDKDLEN